MTIENNTYFWKEKPFSYPVCIPPIHKPFIELSHKEAEAYFQWHLSVLQERIDVLSKEVAHKLQIPRERMDLSPVSLITLWEWFLSIIEIEETPKARLDWFWKTDRHPKEIKEELLNGMKLQYSLETTLIFDDIGKYLGEVFVKNLPGVSWTYYEKPKRDFFVKMPVIQGFADRHFSPPFKMYFEPVHMAGVQAAKIWDGRQQKTDLLDLYHHWASLYFPVDEQDETGD